MTSTPLKIGIVGAGFSGTALAALLCRLSTHPIEVVLCDKTGNFGAGPAYSTPFPHHLLNVRAQDMSAFEDQPTDFTDWLIANPEKQQYLDPALPIAEQFVPRFLYCQYLQYIIANLRSNPNDNFKITFESADVIDIEQHDHHPILIFSDQRRIQVDKVVLALGNNLPSNFPFPVSPDIQCIENPWDYMAVSKIPKNDPVLIVGSGLSMIDAVLSLHHQHHEGVIYAVSRHGLLPLPHGDIKPAYPADKKWLTLPLREIFHELHLAAKSHIDEGRDWRSVINGIRAHVPDIWKRISFEDKKQFLRHVAPYWNIHRHRVHTTIMDLLSKMMNEQQLKVMSGRVQEVRQGRAKIKLRYSGRIAEIPTTWLINCMGPMHDMRVGSPLVGTLLTKNIVALDELQLGFVMTENHALRLPSGEESNIFYALGAPTKGATWEIGAVPEIRRQIFDLTRHLLAMR